MKPWSIFLAAASAVFCSATMANVISMPKGNGVMIYSVASDMYCGQNSSQCPNYVPFAHRLAGSNMVYVMPSTGSLYGQKGNTVVTSCNDISENAGIDYYAEPQLSTKAGNSTKYFFGSCQSGYAVTKYYQSLGKQLKVLPLFDVESLPTTAAAVDAFAQQIANIINNDRNAAGISLDYEPSAKSTLEGAFFMDLAKWLAPKSKLLAVFDGNLNALLPVFLKYKNVIDLDKLYDFAPYSTPAKAMLVSAYKAKLTPGGGKFSIPEGYFYTSQNMPVLFVLPASATDTLYEGIRLYNVNAYSVFKNSSMKSPYSTSVQPCQQPGAGALSVLKQYLCLPKNPKAPYPGCLSNQTQAVESFFNADGQPDVAGIKNYCQYYASGRRMIKYIQTVLPVIQQALIKMGSQKTAGYLGVALYSYRVPAFGDFNGAKAYYNDLGSLKDLKRTWATVPSAISTPVWSYIVKNAPKVK